MYSMYVLYVCMYWMCVCTVCMYYMRACYVCMYAFNVCMYASSDVLRYTSFLGGLYTQLHTYIHTYSTYIHKLTHMPD